MVIDNHAVQMAKIEKQTMLQASEWYLSSSTREALHEKVRKMRRGSGGDGWYKT